MDWLYPALPALGAQPSDIVVLNFAVWLNLEEHYNYHLGRYRALPAAERTIPHAEQTSLLQASCTHAEVAHAGSDNVSCSLESSVLTVLLK